MSAQELELTVLKNNANLKAYYRFESGALTTDSSGNGYTLTNNNTVGEGTGVYGGCADFGTGNTNKYFSVANDMGIQGGAGSIVFWYKTPTTTSASDHESIVSVGDAGTQTSLNVVVGSTGLHASRLRSEVAWNNTSQIAISANTWYHCAASYDGTNLRFYVNGNLIGTVAASGNGSGTSISSDVTRIGTRTDSLATSYADGLVDDLAIFSTALSADQIKELYEGRFLGEAWPQSGLVAGYHLNGSSTDFSGNNNHGTDTAITYSQANGKFGKGAGFNGSTSKIATALTLNTYSNISISSWVRTIDQTNERLIFANDGAGFDNSFQIGIGPEKTTTGLGADKRFEVDYQRSSDSSRLFCTDTIDIPINTWIHYVFTYDGSNMRLYRNGNLVATTALSSATFGTTVSTIGSRGSGRYWYGSLDEVLIFNRALTAQEIRRMYAVGTGKLQ